ncbi:GNAT family N-acetyltransferase [Rhizomicrobium electricum]|uniref:GNAT family N-acetyltransferase n=1 Tax=Rhizomicrobium electricum TaxID=480070 RepID=A0ABN1E0K1_9PROT|nr:GNAT family N-acetyltransferase [Rhizomicrobium electricum]NIJ47359.1 GNAT superfamily N-acetyltransferase [Rhizomicrobium electricum]
MGKVSGRSPVLSGPAPLTAAHYLGAFDCGRPVLNEWLRTRALKNEGRGGSRTYVVCTENQVAAFYAVAAGAVTRERAPSALARNMPDPLPVLIIGRLAVDTRYQRMRLGAALLKDALLRCLNASREIGATAVLVHALDDEAAAFYAQYGFKPFPQEPRTLYLPMAWVAKGL